MRMIVIGKYPPIEGGVSAETYWLCRQLAEEGHQVTVVSNACEVEDEYRMFLDEDSDQTWMESDFPARGGSVRVRCIEKFSNRRMGHIPRSNPYVSRVASVAAQVCSEQDADVMLAYYLEPYGVAAHLVSLWTGIPYVLKHAGSDLDRLMTVPDLSETYRRVILSAAAILTRSDLAGRFLRMGVEPGKIITDMGSYLPAIFQPQGSELDVDVLCAKVSRSEMRGTLTSPNPEKRFDNAVPTIGLYGKIGRAKGSYDLLAALKKVKEQGIRFNLLCLSNGVARQEFSHEVIKQQLADRTWILPFLPHWRIPEFLRRCTSVCFLERDFPVAIHGPQIPREVMRCGRCLIVSEEIVKKQPHLFGGEDNYREIAIVVKDPRDTTALAESLALVLRSPQLAAATGGAAHEWINKRHPFTTVAPALVSVFDRVRGRKRQQNRKARSSIKQAERQMIAAMLLPWSSQIVQSALPELWNSITAEGETISCQAPLLEALSITERLLSMVQEGEFAYRFPPYFGSVVRLEQHQIKLFMNNTVTREPFGHADVLGDRRLTVGLSRALRPLKDRYCEVHTCEYDISDLQKIFESPNSTDVQPTKKISHVLLVPQSNFVLRLFRVAPGALRFLNLCDGRSSLADILDSILKDANGSSVQDLETQLLDLVGQLYQRAAITFVSEAQIAAAA